jgi:hypothetical protein
VDHKTRIIRERRNATQSKEIFSFRGGILLERLELLNIRFIRMLRDTSMVEIDDLQSVLSEQRT